MLTPLSSLKSPLMLFPENLDYSVLRGGYSINRGYDIRNGECMDLTGGFAFYMDRALKKVQLSYLRVFRKHGIDLTIEQWVILQRIYELQPSASQVEISRDNYRDKAATSKVIGGLQKKGLILKERFEADQKRYKLVITPKGSQLVESTLPLVMQLRSVGHQNIAKAEFDVFLKVVNQIWDNYNEMDENL